MAASRCRITNLDFFRFADFQEVCFGCFGFDVVIHLFRKAGIGSVQHPEPPQGIFDQIADNPVRGKELGGRRDVFRGNLFVLLQAGENLVLLLGNIELVEPADHFNILAGIGRHGLAGIGQNGVAGE